MPALQEEQMPCTSVTDAVALIQMEYAELPGLKLTYWQAQRLWDLPDDVCERALTTLTQARILMRTVDGAYVRRASSAVERHPADRRT